ncbi:Dephospho-CoA kinase domain-containing protein [Sarcoptes scabiei]|uniref:Dephospho-CoA kinase domain-containing protein n=1 Tax=Sarcoptes scabiei TaxID=52283 RepID=A0A834VF44_SARSC|nr:Dephospho-CoA kinase domain-containing protein [Sarcoptes scabiei]
MYLIGLTGSIGTGKSTISDYLVSKNIPVIDADQIARDVVKPRTKCWEAIRKHFTNEVILPDGQLDRKKLASIIFNNPSERKLLNSITHPEIQKRTLLRIIYHFLTFQSFVVLDIPLLFEESIFRRYLSYIIVVKCNSDEQMKRIKLRNGWNDQEVRSRIASQMSIEKKCSLADYVIDNDGSISHSYQQLQTIIDNLRYPISFWILRSILILPMVQFCFYCTNLFNIFEI